MGTTGRVYQVDITRRAAPRDVVLTRGNGDQLKWRSADEGHYLVVFEQGSPFGDWKYEIAPGKEVNPGDLRKTLAIPEDETLWFKYTVYSDGWKSDPKVGVKH